MRRKQKVLLVLFSVISFFTIYGCRLKTKRYFREAEKLEREGKYNEAEKLYRQIATRYHEDTFAADSIFRAGEINFLYLENYQQSLKDHLLLIKEYPKSVYAPRAQWRIALIYDKTFNNPTSAIVEYQRLIDNYFFPELVEQAYYNLGNCFFKLNKFNQAITEFTILLNYNPNGKYADDAVFRIGDSYFMEGRLDDAIRTYDKVLKNYPESELVLEAKFCIGKSLEEKGMLEEALKIFNQIEDAYDNKELLVRRIKQVEKKVKLKNKKYKVKW
ncbi:MAG: tetratricopeptide repeat protein [bacterium]